MQQQCNNCNSSRRRRKIVIVGSGAAGIGCARWLLDYFDSGDDASGGAEVVVLEARDRIGGRVHTSSFGGSFVDLGASWLHEHDPSTDPSNPLSVMAKRLNLSLKNTNFDNGIAFDLKGNRIKDKIVEKAWNDLEKAFVLACKPYTSASSKPDGGEGEEATSNVDRRSSLNNSDSSSSNSSSSSSSSSSSASKKVEPDYRIDLESMIKSKVTEEVWENPAFQAWVSDYDFEFGVSLRKLSPVAVDQRWIDSIENDEEEPLNMVFTSTGFRGILDGLISGEATDNAAMRRQQKLLRDRMAVRVQGSSPSTVPSSDGTASVFPSPMASSNSYLSSPSKSTRSHVDILLNHKVVCITDNSRLLASSISSSPLPATATSSSSTARTMASANSRVTLQIELQSPGSRLDTDVDNKNHPLPTQTSPELIEIEADAVVVCLPIGVLKSTNRTHNKVHFVPDLSVSKRAAIEACGFGNAVKVVMEFDKVFWPSSSEFLIIADADLCSPYNLEDSSSSSSSTSFQKRGLLTSFWNLFHVSGKKILVGYGLGDSADLIDRMSDVELEALLLTRLAAICQNAPVGYKPIPLRWMRTRWGSDPYTLGAYSYVPCGESSTDIFEELGRRESVALFFAGEATQTDTNLRASVNGAFQSGCRAAEEVIENLPW